MSSSFSFTSAGTPQYSCQICFGNADGTHQQACPPNTSCLYTEPSAKTISTECDCSTECVSCPGDPS